MKPTQEQVMQWARDSGMELYGLGTDRAKFVYYLEAFAAIAYEAGRKDENVAVEKEIAKEDLESLDDQAYWILVALLAWLRARREQ